MANLEKAIQWLREGKRICRPDWDSYSYWELGPNEIIKFGDMTVAEVHLKQLEADDWKLWKNHTEEIKNGME